MIFNKIGQHVIDYETKLISDVTFKGGLKTAIIRSNVQFKNTLRVQLEIEVNGKSLPTFKSTIKEACNFYFPVTYLGAQGTFRVRPPNATEWSPNIFISNIQKDLIISCATSDKFPFSFVIVPSKVGFDNIFEFLPLITFENALPYPLNIRVSHLNLFNQN